MVVFLSVTMVSNEYLSFPGSGLTHKCPDWDAITSWAIGNRSGNKRQVFDQLEFILGGSNAGRNIPTVCILLASRMIIKLIRP
jgi:hypothetical protein